MELKVPTIAIIIGEGGSGGAIALASSNKVLMLENAIYSVISPEGCATILWRDPKKMLDAAKAMKLSAKDLLKLKVIDEIIPLSSTAYILCDWHGTFQKFASCSRVMRSLWSSRSCQMEAIGNYPPLKALLHTSE